MILLKEYFRCVSRFLFLVGKRNVKIQNGVSVMLNYKVDMSVLVKGVGVVSIKNLRLPALKVKSITQRASSKCLVYEA